MEKLSVILPSYNDCKRLSGNINRLIDYLKQEELCFEIIVVNDGSTDNTSEVFEKFHYEDTEYHYVSYPDNHGKGYAIKQGIKAATGDYLIFMDVDLSTDIHEIKNFWDKRETADLLIGNRKSQDAVVKNKSFIRKIISASCNNITKLIVPVSFGDTQCGFKMFNKKAAALFIEKQTIYRYAFDVEYIYICQLNNLKVLDLPVKWTDDKNGQINLFRSSVRFMYDLIKIRMRMKGYR